MFQLLSNIINIIIIFYLLKIKGEKLLKLAYLFISHSNHNVTIYFKSKNTSPYKLSFQWLDRLWTITWNFILAWISHCDPNPPKHTDDVSNQIQNDYRGFHFHLYVSLIKHFFHDEIYFSAWLSLKQRTGNRRIGGIGE